jgi:hypothetical protein
MVLPPLLKPLLSVLGVPYEVKEINVTPYEETTSVCDISNSVISMKLAYK